MKICIKCGVEKTESQFHPSPRMKDGYRNDCIECRKIYHRMNSKLHYAKTKASKLVKVKAYALEHKEEIAQRMAIYCQTDEYKVKHREHNRKRRADKTGHPHRAFLSRRYYARLHDNGGYCTRQQLKARWDYYGNQCWICHQPAKETDHVKPVSKGGTHWPANLRPICIKCNRSKGNHWPYIPQTIETLSATLSSIT